MHNQTGEICICTWERPGAHWCLVVTLAWSVSVASAEVIFDAWYQCTNAMHSFGAVCFSLLCCSHSQLHDTFALALCICARDIGTGIGHCRVGCAALNLCCKDSALNSMR